MSPKAQDSLKGMFSTLGEVSGAQWLWIATAGIALGTLVVGVFGIQRPWQQRKQQMASQYQEAQDRAALVNSIKNQSSQLDKQKESVLLKGGTPVLVSEVTRIASKTGIGIESVVPQSEAAFGPFTRFQIEIQASASFLNLIEFLHNLERHEPLLKIDRLELAENIQPQAAARSAGEPPDAGGPTDRHKIMLLISAFSRPGNP